MWSLIWGCAVIGDSVGEDSGAMDSGESDEMGDSEVQDTDGLVETSETGDPTGEVLTVWIPIGEFPHCQRFDVSECRIARLELDLATRELREGEVVIDVPGSFSPSIAPSGEWMSMDRSVSGGLDVVVRSLLTGEELSLGSGNKSHWRTDTEVLFGITDESLPGERWGDVGGMTVSFDPLQVASPLTRWIGGATSISSDCAGEDPYVHPEHANLVAFHNSPYWEQLGSNDPHTCPWMAELPNFDYKNPQPVVADITATEWTEGSTYWRFYWQTGAPHPGCAHLAFSPDGEQVLCTDQPTFYYETYLPPNGPAYEVGFNRIYGFERQPLDDVEGYFSVRGPEPLFEHRAPWDLEDIEDIWDPADERTCDTYYTKRAEYCGSSDRIIANVYCGTVDDSLQQDALFARVMLIEFSDPENPIYTDLTSLMEDHLGHTRGELGAFSASCSVGEE